MSVTLTEIKEDLLRKLYIEIPNLAPQGILDDVLMAINGACQMLNVAGNPFWRETSATLTGVTGTTPSTMTDAQRIISMKNATGRPLIRAANEDECKFAHEIFQGLTTAGADNPALVYAVASVFNATTGGFTFTIHFGPQPLATQDLTVSYIKVFTNYLKSDLENDVKIVSVPFEYVETILLPIARYLVTTSHFFSNKEAIPVLKEGYQAAMNALQDANPEIAFPSISQLVKGASR